jgi:hypothetical protein
MKEVKFIKEGWSAHQGDVQIHLIEGVPKNAKKIRKTFFAKSEKTGHCHALLGDYELFEVENDEKIIKVGSNGCTLNHVPLRILCEEHWDKNQILPAADHETITVPPGVFHVGIQRKVDPFKKAWEKVTD